MNSGLSHRTRLGRKDRWWRGYRQRCRRRYRRQWRRRWRRARPRLRSHRLSSNLIIERTRRKRHRHHSHSRRQTNVQQSDVVAQNETKIKSGSKILTLKCPAWAYNDRTCYLRHQYERQYAVRTQVRTPLRTPLRTRMRLKKM